MNLVHLGLPIVAPAERNSSSVELSVCAGTQENIRRVAAAGSGAIMLRLQELEDETPIESILEITAASLSLITLVLGMTLDSRWFVLPVVISAMLLQQMLQGWCPLLPALRALGFRTERQICLERHALEQIELEHSECHLHRASLSAAPQLSTSAASSAPETPFSLRDFLHVGAQ